MIAIASGLLGNLETATSTVVKKDGISGAFAAAFEEVSAKDASAVAQAGARGQGRRVGGNRGAHAGMVGGRTPRSAASSQKAAVAKASREGASEDTVAELDGAVAGGLPGKVAPSAGGNAARPDSPAKLSAAKLFGAGTNAKVELASEDADGLSVDEGTSSGAPNRLESAGSTVGGALRDSRGKASLQNLAESAAPDASATTAVQAAEGVSRSGRLDAGTMQTRPVALVAADANAPGNAVIGPIPDVVAGGDSMAGRNGPEAVQARFQEGIGGNGIASAHEAEPLMHVAVDVSGRTARAYQESPVTQHGLQQLDGIVQVQTGGGPIVSVTSASIQEVDGQTGRQGAKVAPKIGPARGLAEQMNDPSAAVLGVTAQASGSGKTAVALPSTAEGSVMARRVVAQSPVSQLSPVRQAVIQQATVQAVPRVPEGMVGLVAQDAASLARGYGAPAAGNGQVTPQQAITAGGGGQQDAVAPAGTEQSGVAEKNTIAQTPDQGVSGAAKTVQHMGKPVDAGVDAGKEKHAPGVTASAVAQAKKDAARGVAEASTSVAVSTANAAVVSASSPAPSPVTTPHSAAVAPVVERTTNAPGSADVFKANTAAIPIRGASASPLRAGNLTAQASAPVAAQGLDPQLGAAGVDGQPAILEGSVIPGGTGPTHDSTAPDASAITEIAGLYGLHGLHGLQAGGDVAGGAVASREHRPATAEDKTAERTSGEKAASAQPITQQHVAGAGQDTPQASRIAHPSPSEAGTQSLAPGVAGLGGGGGIVPLAASQVALHGAVTPTAAATSATSGLTASSTSTAATAGLSSPALPGADSLLSPMAHTTLQATPTVLEVGIPGGTRGWLKIRAEIGEGGTVQASMSAATHEGQETLRRELPAINAFLDSEHVPVSVQVAAHGVSGAAASSVAGGDAGFNPGASLSQDAGAGQREAQTGLLAGGDGARQGNGEGPQDSNRASVPGSAWNVREPVAAEADWIANAEPGTGYGSGMIANGGNWLNVMA